VLDVLSTDAPPLSARRALGVLVELALARRETPVDSMASSEMVIPQAPGTDAPASAAPSGAPTPSSDAAASEETPASARPATPTRAPRIPPRRAFLALFWLGIVVVAGGAYALLRASIPLPAGPPPAARAPSPPLPSQSAVQRLPEPVGARPPTAPATPIATSAAVAAPSPATRRGTLVVTAYPWGFVEIDGRALGRAPVRAVLDEGEHRIRVRADAVVRTRRARVVAGETREVLVAID
jgi:serine/threonine-protein kinase